MEAAIYDATSHICDLSALPEGVYLVQVSVVIPNGPYVEALGRQPQTVKECAFAVTVTK